MKQWMVGVVVLCLSAGMLAQAGASKTAAKAPTKKAAAAAEESKEASATVHVPSDATVDAFLKRMWGYNENLAFKVVSVKAVGTTGLSEAIAVVNTPQGQQVLRFYVTADGEHAIMGELMPFGTDPFLKDRSRLKKDAFGAAKGTKDAPLLIVEFADLECPACKAALPVVQKLQADFPQARFVFQSFPLDIHPWAALAAQYLDCVARRNDDAGWTFIESVYAHQGEITPENAKEKLDKYAGFANQDPATIATCAQSPEAIARVQQSIALGKDLNVNQTPTLFVNGRGITGMNSQDYDGLKAVVQYELEQAGK